MFAINNMHVPATHVAGTAGGGSTPQKEGGVCEMPARLVGEELSNTPQGVFYILVTS